MEMTKEECQDYNKLTPEEKQEFEYQSKKHPDWTFKQVMAKIVFDRKVDGTIGRGGNDVDAEDPDTWIIILKGARQALKKFKSIGNAIFVAIDTAIISLKTLIKQGVRRIGDIINNLKNKLF